MVRKILFGLALVALMAQPALAQIQVQVGVGPARSFFIGEDGDIFETNVGGFFEIGLGIHSVGESVGPDGTPYEDHDRWLSLGYTIQGEGEPFQGLYLVPSFQVGEIWLGGGFQAEIWDETLFGETRFAGGGRIFLEFPEVIEAIPVRLSGSIVTDGTIKRVEFSLTGVG